MQKLHGLACVVGYQVPLPGVSAADLLMSQPHCGGLIAAPMGLIRRLRLECLNQGSALPGARRPVALRVAALQLPCL